MKPLFCAAACLAAAACASGGPGARPDERAAGPTLNPAGLLIASFDADGDYRVGGQELAAGIDRALSAADANRDGAVSMIELGDWRERAFGDPNGLPGPYAFDADQNGQVSGAEFRAALMESANGYRGATGEIAFSALIMTPGAPRARREDASDGFRPERRSDWPPDGEVPF